MKNTIFILLMGPVLSAAACNGAARTATVSAQHVTDANSTTAASNPNASNPNTAADANSVTPPHGNSPVDQDPNGVTDPNTIKDPNAPPPKPVTGPTQDANQISGTVEGKSLTPQSEMFFELGAQTPGGNHELMMVLGGAANECTTLGNSQQPSATTYLSIDLGNIVPGVYTIVDPFTVTPSTFSGPNAVAGFIANDAQCNETLTPEQADAVSGQVKVDSYDGTQLKGSFNLAMGLQKDPISGSFNATACAAVPALTLDSSSLTCK